MDLKINKKSYIIAIVAFAVFVALANFLKNATGAELKAMQVVLSAKVPKDDVFQFFYWEQSETNFQIKKSVRSEVKGLNDFQEIVFQLPNIVDLYRIRLDIGENKEQGDVIIREIRFIKEDEEYGFDINAFNRLFAPNKYITQQGKDNFRGKTLMVNSKSIYDPYFISIDGSEELNLIRINRLTRYPNLIAAFAGLVLFLFMMNNMNSTPISKKGIFSFIFLLMLIAPLIQYKFQMFPVLENIEKRELTPKPPFSFSKHFARNFEAYFNDHFGFRNYLIDWGGTFRTKFFRASMNPERVMFGRDKWLFYNSSEERMYRSYSRTSPLSRDNLKKLVDQWEERKRIYNVEGRKYGLAFWPNKHSIYSEYLPASMKMQIRDTLSRADQIIKFIKTNNRDILFTDVRPKLINSKGKHLLYHKFDTHWNEYGAFLAYQDFFKQNPQLGIVPKSKEDFTIVWQDYGGGELIQMLGIRNKGFFIEKNPKFALKEHSGQIEYLPIDGFPRLTVITKNELCNNKLRALVFRDSFTNSLIPFISLHFNEVYYIWGDHQEFVKRLQPDVIIEGFVERELGERIP